MRLPLALCLVCLAAPAAALDPCAKFDDPLAYNACLARSGPVARPAHVVAAPAEGAGPSSAPRPRGPYRGVSMAGRRVHSRIDMRTAHGRSEMVFSVGR